MRAIVLVGLPVLAALGLWSCAPPGSSPAVDGGPAPPPVASATTLPPCSWAAVTRVVDGDTIHVRLDGKDETVRYIGVDAPETVKPGTAVQPFGLDASAYNKRLVMAKSLCLEKDISERDRFGRLLRYAWLADGRLVNEELLLAGLAQVSTFPPDVKYVERRFLPAQRLAREARTGLWAVPGGN